MRESFPRARGTLHLTLSAYWLLRLLKTHGLVRVGQFLQISAQTGAILLSQVKRELLSSEFKATKVLGTTGVSNEIGDEADKALR